MSERARHAGALALYSAFSLLLIDHGVNITQKLSGQGSDPYDSPWFLAWWPYAVLHHKDPFFTQLVWQPVGVSLGWITSVPVLSLLFMPVTLTAGPVVTYNILIILAPILSALFAYLACWRIARNWRAALIGGFLFGFSSYEMAQVTAALNLCMTFCLPALLLLVLERLDDELSRARAALLGGLLLLVQFLISIEIFALIFVFGGIAWALAMLYLPERRVVLRRLVADALCAAPIVLIPLVPLLFSMSRHFGLIHHPEAWPYFFTTDLLNLFIPSGFNLFGAPFAAVSAHFNGGVQEQDGYIGLPLLFILWRFAREHGGGGQGRLLVVMFLVALIASFGPRLWIAGHYSGLVLPWMLAVHLPLLNGALPVRFALFTSLAAAIIASLWVSGAPRRGWRLVIALLACIVLLPRWHPWRDIPASAFFEPGRVQEVLGPNPRILILPFSINGASSFWQQENKYGFTQTGGYLGFPPAPMQKYLAVGDMFGNVMEKGFLPSFVQFCEATHTQYIVIHDGAQPAIAAAIATLGWKAQKIDDVTVLTVP